MAEILPSVQPGQTKIGWVGTGVMGRSMCCHLLNAGFSVTVFNRTKMSAQPLLDAGASWADTAMAVAQASDVIFAIVGMPADVRNVFLGPTGILAGCKPGNIIIDMTTSQPALALEIFHAAEKLQVPSIDAPVSGGDVGAKNGTLSIMIGGEAKPVATLDPCWRAMGKTIVHQGGPGSGQHAKMVNQILVAAGMVGVCESLLYAYRAGLDLDTVLQSVSSGAAGSWALSNLGPRMVENNFAPGFFVDHFVKDLGIAVAESKRLGLELPGLELADRMYGEVQRQGCGKNGTQILIKSLAKVSGINWEQRS